MEHPIKVDDLGETSISSLLIIDGPKYREKNPLWITMEKMHFYLFGEHEIFPIFHHLCCEQHTWLVYSPKELE